MRMEIELFNCFDGMLDPIMISLYCQLVGLMLSGSDLHAPCYGLDVFGRKEGRH